MASLKPAVKAISKLFKPSITIDDNDMLQIARRIDEKRRQDDKKVISPSPANAPVNMPAAEPGSLP